MQAVQHNVNVTINSARQSRRIVFTGTGRTFRFVARIARTSLVDLLDQRWSYDQSLTALPNAQLTQPIDLIEAASTLVQSQSQMQVSHGN